MAAETRLMSRKTNPPGQESTVWFPQTNMRGLSKPNFLQLSSTFQKGDAQHPPKNHSHLHGNPHTLPSIISLVVAANSYSLTLPPSTGTHMHTDTQPPDATSPGAPQPPLMPGSRLCSEALTGITAAWSTSQLLMVLFTDLALLFLFVLLRRGHGPNALLAHFLLLLEEKHVPGGVI